MKTLSTGLCLAALVGFGMQAGAAITNASLMATNDTYTQEGAPTTNFGTSTTVLVRKDAANTLTRGGYFEFDLSSLPAGAIISAKLQLFGSQDSGGTGVSIKALGGTPSAVWNETALVYNNALTLSAVDFNGTPLATTAVSPPPSKIYEWNVTAYIASRRSAGHATIGLGYTAANEYRSTFNSAEAPTNQPKLVVTVDIGGTGGLQNWPMFGRDYENTRTSTDTVISAANASSLRTVWRSPGGGITSTPTIVDGIAYVSTFHGFVKAIRLSNPTTPLWSVQPSTSVTMLAPSPYVDVPNNRVYVAGNNGMVFALDRTTGRTLWSRQIEASTNSRVSSSPILVDNILIVGSGSYQVFFAGTPMFRGKVVFLNATTGVPFNYITNMCPDTVPVTCGGGISVWSTAAVDKATRTGYIGTGQAYAAPAGKYSDALVAFNIDTGKIIWSYQFTPNDVYTTRNLGNNLDHDVGAAPNLFTAVVNGVTRQLVGVGDKSGRYAAFDRVTGGNPVWIKTIGNGSQIGGMMHSAAYNNGRIYVVNNQSMFGSGSRNDPVPASGVARALDAGTGNFVWTKDLPQGGFGGVSIANGLMYFTTWNGLLYVLDTNKLGSIVKTVQASEAPGAYIGPPTEGFPNGSASGPMVYQGRVYVGYGWTWVLNIDGGLAAIGL